jgi:hypothetical protein
LSTFEEEYEDAGFELDIWGLKLDFYPSSRGEIPFRLEIVDAFFRL